MGAPRRLALGKPWSDVKQADRKDTDGKEAEIRRLLALDVSKASIAKITGVDRSTLYHFIRSRRL